MDEDYARKLRAWLRAEPGATPRRTDEERQWLRDVPAPQPDPDRWTVRGRLPEPPPADDDWVCPVIALPVPRRSEENGCRMSDAEVRSRRNHPSAWPRGETRPLSDAEARSCRDHPSAWPRDAAEPQPRPLSEAEVRSRRNHPSATPREEPAPPRPLTEAEARSRWNHPTNWHRRRRQAENPETPGNPEDR
ncbi:hypothetical protein M8542_46695 [Amycolatopsis sp. OK19-0408]|uniref:Uncharacterized protein n=1 Tax=Amycolatopsis iheyensis TaxID=2945988 RepID=A0A9X2NK78_9PSEU|nr:hypothetical protein [Amycolatopsis iheyensis]MCR6490321.1 hypothetical protein [Amycolatopsis iheyensis]